MSKSKRPGKRSADTEFQNQRNSLNEQVEQARRKRERHKAVKDENAFFREILDQLPNQKVESWPDKFLIAGKLLVKRDLDLVLPELNEKQKSPAGRIAIELLTTACNDDRKGLKERIKSLEKDQTVDLIRSPLENICQHLIDYPYADSTRLFTPRIEGGQTELAEILGDMPGTSQGIISTKIGDGRWIERDKTYHSRNFADNKELQHRVDEYQTAIHEAGHFVACYRLDPERYQITLTIEPKDGMLGHVIQEPFCFDVNTEDGAKDETIILLAGYAAEYRWSPQAAEETKAGSDPDNEKAAELIESFELNEKDLRTKTTELIEKHWAEITALAKLLSKHKTIDTNAAEIVCNHIGDGSPLSSFIIQSFPCLAEIERPDIAHREK